MNIAVLIGFIYFIVIILACTVGALTGMGGGVIIKPVFDAIGAHNLVSISFYSSVAVLTMAVVSTIRQWRNGITFPRNEGLVAVGGAVVGGILGDLIFEELLIIFNNDLTVQWIQIILTIISLLFALLYTVRKWESFNLSGKSWFFLVGVLLGILAALLGIGGGPINVAALMLLFGIPIKRATVYSIVIILFSQLSKLITIGFTMSYSVFDLNILLYIIPASIIGGLLGARLSKLLMEKFVVVAYQVIVVLVIMLNIANGFVLS